MTPELIAGKRATAAMIKGVGGLEAGAEFCRVGKSVLGEAQNVNCPERWVTIDVVADLEPLARERQGWPHVTRWLCQQMGGVFVLLPSAPPSRAHLLGSMGRIAKDAADVTQAICEAIGDGEIDPGENSNIRAKIQAAQADLAALDAQLATLAGDN